MAHSLLRTTTRWSKTVRFSSVADPGGGSRGYGSLFEILTFLFANSVPFSLITYATHCLAWLSYGKRLWPSAARASYCFSTDATGS